MTSHERAARDPSQTLQQLLYMVDKRPELAAHVAENPALRAFALVERDTFASAPRALALLVREPGCPEALVRLAVEALPDVAERTGDAELVARAILARHELPPEVLERLRRAVRDRVLKHMRVREIDYHRSVGLEADDPMAELRSVFAGEEFTATSTGAALADGGLLPELELEIAKRHPAVLLSSPELHDATWEVLANSLGGRHLQRLFEHPRCPPWVFARAVRNPAFTLQEASSLMMRRDVPGDAIAALYAWMVAQPPFERSLGLARQVLVRIGAHRATPLATLRRFVREQPAKVLQEVVMREPSPALCALARASGREEVVDAVDMAVRQHAVYLPTQVSERDLDDERDALLTAAREVLPAGFREALLRNVSPLVRLTMAARPDLTRGEAEVLAGDPDVRVARLARSRMEGAEVDAAA